MDIKDVPSAEGRWEVLEGTWDSSGTSEMTEIESHSQSLDSYPQL